MSVSRCPRCRSTDVGDVGFVDVEEAHERVWKKRMRGCGREAEEDVDVGVRFGEQSIADVLGLSVTLLVRRRRIIKTSLTPNLRNFNVSSI